MRTVTYRDLMGALNMTRKGLMLWRRSGKLPPPIPGSHPHQWDESLIRQLIADGKLERTKGGRPRKAVA